MRSLLSFGHAALRMSHAGSTGVMKTSEEQNWRVRQMAAYDRLPSEVRRAIYNARAYVDAEGCEIFLRSGSEADLIMLIGRL